MNKQNKGFDYVFSSAGLEQLAYTHPSCRETGGDNQRLEFLGDAVLDLVIAEQLYQCLPGANEGTLDRARAALVNGKSLATLAREIGLDQRLIVSESQRQHHPEPSDAMLEDCFEALVGAIYLDGGLGAAGHFIKSTMARRIAAAVAEPQQLNPKSRLQEWTQAKHGGAVPSYARLDSGGPDHARHYRVGVSLFDEQIGTGSGSSIKAAEAAAAADALQQLELDA
ncbi:MAG: ribonuclease III [Opitutales bacterium]